MSDLLLLFSGDHKIPEHLLRIQKIHCWKAQQVLLPLLWFLQFRQLNHSSLPSLFLLRLLLFSVHIRWLKMSFQTAELCLILHISVLLYGNNRKSHATVHAYLHILWYDSDKLQSVFPKVQFQQSDFPALLLEFHHTAETVLQIHPVSMRFQPVLPALSDKVLLHKYCLCLRKES